jgi:hypothetical protein
VDIEALAAMLREDRAQWEALAKVLEAHPGGTLHDAGSPWWTSRDVYAHLARWIERSTAHLEARLAGRTLPPLEGTDDDINARWQQEDSRLSVGEARERARTAFERRLRVIDGVAIDRWNEELQAIARADGADHYRAHRNYIVVV